MPDSITIGTIPNLHRIYIGRIGKAQARMQHSSNQNFYSLETEYRIRNLHLTFTCVLSENNLEPMSLFLMRQPPGWGLDIHIVAQIQSVLERHLN